MFAFFGRPCLRRRMLQPLPLQRGKTTMNLWVPAGRVRGGLCTCAKYVCTSVYRTSSQLLRRGTFWGFFLLEVLPRFALLSFSSVAGNSDDGGHGRVDCLRPYEAHRRRILRPKLLIYFLCVYENKGTEGFRPRMIRKAAEPTTQHIFPLFGCVPEVSRIRRECSLALETLFLSAAPLLSLTR